MGKARCRNNVSIFLFNELSAVHVVQGCLVHHLIDMKIIALSINGKYGRFCFVDAGGNRFGMYPDVVKIIRTGIHIGATNP